MTTKTKTESRTAAMAREERAAPKRTIPFADRRSLAASQGPAVLPVWLPVAEEIMFVRRPHLPTLARSGRIPRPLQTVITQLTQVGIPQTKQNAGAEEYLKMALALTRACAVVPPAEAVAEAEVAAALLADVALLEPEITRAQFPEPGSYQLALAEARMADAVAIQEARRRALDYLAAALAGVDANALEPLFGPEESELGPEQMRLVLDPEEAIGDPPEQVCCLHRSDLVELVSEIFSNAPGAMRRFRN